MQIIMCYRNNACGANIVTRIIRFAVSLDRELLKTFDRVMKARQYTNLFEVITDLIRDHPVQKEWEGNREVAGTIPLVFNHHKRELVCKPEDIQHRRPHVIIFPPMFIEARNRNNRLE